jgi:hypothetical protein
MIEIRKKSFRRPSSIVEVWFSSLIHKNLHFWRSPPATQPRGPRSSYITPPPQWTLPLPSPVDSAGTVSCGCLLSTGDRCLRRPNPLCVITSCHSNPKLPPSYLCSCHQGIFVDSDIDGWTPDSHLSNSPLDAVRPYVNVWFSDMCCGYCSQGVWQNP